MQSKLSKHRSQLLASRAHAMRVAPTSSERRLFEALRAAFPCVAFRRQVPLCGRFIADLYVPSLRLVIEVDGGYHARTGRADARRDHAFLRAGYRVVRIEAALVMCDVSVAVERVRFAIACRPRSFRPTLQRRFTCRAPASLSAIGVAAIDM
jgi:very-short-patch-repair endonuclease